MVRTIEIIGIVILILFVISIVTMPWPANIVLGGLVFFSSAVVFIYGRGAKKKEQSDRNDK